MLIISCKGIYILQQGWFSGAGRICLLSLVYLVAGYLIGLGGFLLQSNVSSYIPFYRCKHIENDIVFLK